MTSFILIMAFWKFSIYAWFSKASISFYGRTFYIKYGKEDPIIVLNVLKLFGVQQSCFTRTVCGMSLSSWEEGSSQLSYCLSSTPAFPALLCYPGLNTFLLCQLLPDKAVPVRVVLERGCKSGPGGRDLTPFASFLSASAPGALFTQAAALPSRWDSRNPFAVLAVLAVFPGFTQS